ncbi:MAG: sialidase family protein [Candidatus Latescibacterota bacterium]
MAPGIAVRAANFESRSVYHSPDPAGYAAWVGFYPGEAGQWYLSFVENVTPDEPLPAMTPEQWYAFSIPVGYEQSRYRQEHVILESGDGLQTWQPVSRAVLSATGTFSDVRTRDGRFLRFVWGCYGRARDLHAGSIYYVSADDGGTWEKQPPFHDRRFASYPHRARTLGDGTIVLALPLSRLWSVDQPRACVDLNARGSCQMHLCFSADQGRTWSGPLPLYGGQDVSETDFVELPSGDLLCINNSIFANPGRQLVYRTATGFVPGPFEASHTPERVPETVCATEDGILVGCMRGPWYAVSDDEGLSWEPLQGLPPADRIRGHVYQPYVQHLGGGRIACAGHFGADDPVGLKQHENYIMLHTFGLEVRQRSQQTRIEVRRDYDERTGRYLNAYTLTLTCQGRALPGMELEFWYAERWLLDEEALQGMDAADEPLTEPPVPLGESPAAYDNHGRRTLAERMALGGTTLRVTTDALGQAHVSLPQLDRIQYIHHSIRFVVRFNWDRRYPEYRPVQTLQYEFYSLMYQDGPRARGLSPSAGGPLPG